MSAAPSRIHVLIAGAGIGGLTLALKLHELGVRVTVAEAVREIRPLGVGINLLPHGTAMLCRLGLAERLAATGIETRAIEYRTRFGQLILSDLRGREAGFPWPQYSIHRGHLQFLLLDAVRERLPAGSVLTGMRCVRFDQDSSGVSAQFESQESGEIVTLRADALVGADGTRSAVCQQLYPQAYRLRSSGVTMWRGAVEQAPFLDGRTMVIAGHHDCKAVIYPMSKEATQRGRALINWVAELRLGDSHPDADWHARGRAEDFVWAYEDWKFDWLDVPALFRATRDVFVYPMADRDPLPRWSFGRVTLLGDAAHPMYPIGANGASQAILDAEALGEALLSHDWDIEAAFAAYEQERRPKTAQVVLSNRAKGPEAVLGLAHERVKSPKDNVAELVKQEELDAITNEYRRIAGFEKEVLREWAARSNLRNPSLAQH